MLTTDTPLRADNDHDEVREQWSREKKMAFEVMKPACLALVSTDGPVSITLWHGNEVKQRYGHNRGVWPAKVSKTGAWKDTVSATYDKNPWVFIGTQFRVWCRSAADRDRLATSVVDLIAARAEADGGLEELRNGFQDLGPDFSLQLFEDEIHTVAHRLRVAVWDDEALSRFLDCVVADARKIVASGARGKFHPVEVAIAQRLGG